MTFPRAPRTSNPRRTLNVGFRGRFVPSLRVMPNGLLRGEMSFFIEQMVPPSLTPPRVTRPSPQPQPPPPPAEQPVTRRFSVSVSRPPTAAACVHFAGEEFGRSWFLVSPGDSPTCQHCHILSQVPAAGQAPAADTTPPQPPPARLHTPGQLSSGREAADPDLTSASTCTDSYQKASEPGSAASSGSGTETRTSDQRRPDAEPGRMQSRDGVADDMVCDVDVTPEKEQLQDEVRGPEEVVEDVQMISSEPDQLPGTQFPEKLEADLITPLLNIIDQIPEQVSEGESGARSVGDHSYHIRFVRPADRRSEGCDAQVQVPEPAVRATTKEPHSSGHVDALERERSEVLLPREGGDDDDDGGVAVDADGDRSSGESRAVICPHHVMQLGLAEEYADDDQYSEEEYSEFVSEDDNEDGAPADVSEDAADGGNVNVPESVYREYVSRCQCPMMAHAHEHEEVGRPAAENQSGHDVVVEACEPPRGEEVEQQDVPDVCYDVEDLTSGCGRSLPVIDGSADNTPEKEETAASAADAGGDDGKLPTAVYRRRLFEGNGTEDDSVDLEREKAAEATSSEVGHFSDDDIEIVSVQPVTRTKDSPRLVFHLVTAPEVDGVKDVDCTVEEEDLSEESTPRKGQDGEEDPPPPRGAKRTLRKVRRGLGSEERKGAASTSTAEEEPDARWTSVRSLRSQTPKGTPKRARKI